MKKLLLILLFPAFAFAQVGINITNPDPSSTLDINSQLVTGFGGLKVPVVATNAERSQINVSNNDSGLLIFNEESNCLEVYDGENGSWVVFDYCSASEEFEEGDFMFTGIRATNPDEFSIIPMKDVPSGLEFYITDCGVKADGISFRTNEGLLKWNVTTPINALTEIKFTSNNGSWSVTTGTATIFTDPNNLYGNNFDIGSKGPAFTVNGDQIIFFTTSDDSDPLNNVSKFVTALSLESGWDPNGATSTDTSALPNGLIQGTNASTLPSDGDNKSLICDPSLQGMDTATLRAYLSDDGNWSHSNDRANVNVPSGCTF